MCLYDQPTYTHVAILVYSRAQIVNELCHGIRIPSYPEQRVLLLTDKNDPLPDPPPGLQWMVLPVSELVIEEMPA